MKDFNVLIDGKRFFNVPKKRKEKRMKKLLKKAKIKITQLVIY